MLLVDAFMLPKPRLSHNRDIIWRLLYTIKWRTLLCQPILYCFFFLNKFVFMYSMNIYYWKYWKTFLVATQRTSYRYAETKCSNKYWKIISPWLGLWIPKGGQRTKKKHKTEQPSFFWTIVNKWFTLPSQKIYFHCLFAWESIRRRFVAELEELTGLYYFTAYGFRPSTSHTYVGPNLRHNFICLCHYANAVWSCIEYFHIRHIWCAMTILNLLASTSLFKLNGSSISVSGKWHSFSVFNSLVFQ